MLSSLETSPASSYSASPLPPDADDDEEDEEFKDTLEAAPERFVKEAPKKSANGLANGLAHGLAHGLANGYAPALNGYGRGLYGDATERGRSATRAPPPQRRALHAESDAGVVDISEPIAGVVTRLQQDLQQVMGRLGSLERAMLSRDTSSRNQKPCGGSTAGPVAQRKLQWWPLHDLQPRTALLLVLWPFVVHLALAWLQRRRRTHLSP